MKAETEFMVMTINAGGARRARQKQLNPQQLADDLATLIHQKNINPAIIAVQETHRVWSLRASSYSETSEELAKKLGGQYKSFFSPYIDSDHHIHKQKWQQPAFEGYERIQQGNAIITKMEPASWPWSSPEQNYPGYGKFAFISTQISHASVYSSGNRDTEPRNLVVVPLKISEKTSLYFIVTHLTTLSGEDRHNLENPRSQQASIVRLAQVKEILRIVDELRTAEDKSELNARPIILAGDFNARPDSPEINKLEQTFVNCPLRWDSSVVQEVWTHIGYKIHVDYIFHNDPDGLLTLKDCFILEPNQVEEVTDHLPVVAKFNL